MKKAVIRPVRIHAPRGFSLVITIVMLMLLALLAVGMLALAQIELRSADRSAAMQEARNNARLALDLAIGELQKHAGPDQRVTGETVFDGRGGEPPDQARWTGVWRSTMPDGSPVIRRNGEKGGLRDQRVSAGWDPRDDLLAQLVSGNEAGIRYRAEDGPDADEFELLVGEGSGQTSADQVRVPRVGLKSGDDLTGEYAWWVGDLGIKANVATPDRFEDSANGEIRRLQIAQDQSLAAVPEMEEVSSVRRSGFITPGQVGLGEGKGGVLGKYFHHFTTESESVLADVREGGLKKDLTAYLQSSGSVADQAGEGMAALGLSDADRLIGPPNERAAMTVEDGGQAERYREISPTFGLLRHWANRSSQTSYQQRVMDVDHPETRNRNEDKMQSYGGHNLLPVKFENRTKSDVTPVLVEGSIYYNLSAYETGDEDPRRRLGLRLHLYPRVAIWNPYNIELELDPSMVALQINGSKQIEVTLADKRTQSFKASWGNLQSESGGWQRWRRGTHYFRLDDVTIPPGATVVFSPAENRPYDETNFAANRLVPGRPPDPTRSFYQDRRRDGDPLFKARQTFPPNPGIADSRLMAEPLEWREVVPPMPQGDTQAAGFNQADDYFMYWKPITKGGTGSIDLRAFNRLPHGRYVSCAFQYGDEDELPVEWSSRDPVPFARSSEVGVTFQAPDRRTRDGFRMRWFEEHPSNEYGSGSLAGTPHLQTAAIANWNVRTSYSFRSAFENVSDVAPHFFGMYTRDLFDDAVSWSAMTPRSSGSLQLGDPFDQPQAGSRRVLFDLSREQAEVVSLGAFQHLKFSEFAWHPTYAFGNSLADPRIEPAMTEPDRSLRMNEWEGGWNRDTIGYATDGRSNNPSTYNSDSWAQHARGLLEQIVREQNVVFDLSYELNHSLWDRYFLSTGTAAEKQALLDAPGSRPLPNGRLRPTEQADIDTLVDFHRSASGLILDGGFNVNSTSPMAWESLLLSSVGVRTASGGVVFPRILNPEGDEWDGISAESEDAWNGQRVLSREEVARLADAIAEQVRLRGPFLSMSDFVNRRLRDDATGEAGALEAALEASGINDSFRQSWPLDNRESLPDYNHADNIKDPTRVEQTLKPATTAWGALGHLTQADLLQSLGPALVSRSDTFVIRAFGSSIDRSGKVVARAWCEAVVQRTPEPVVADDSGINPRIDGPVDFGRRFVVKRFRWLKPEEV